MSIGIELHASTKALISIVLTDKPKQPRLRVILPVTYLLVSMILFGGCFLRLGHSVWCQYFLSSMFPAGLLGAVTLRSLVRSRLIAEDSDTRRWLEGLLTVIVPFISL